MDNRRRVQQLPVLTVVAALTFNLLALVLGAGSVEVATQSNAFYERRAASAPPHRAQATDRKVLVRRLYGVGRCRFHRPHPHPGCSQAGSDPKRSDERLRWPKAILWAWEDLNLRPHPYQLNAGNRCADRRFPRSRLTVGAKVMRSIRAQVCVQESAS
jgi:hypothetical protein